MKATTILCLALALVINTGAAVGKDNGQWAANSLKSWFDKLSSGKGLCCSVADGRTLDDPDWSMDGDTTNYSGYRVRVDGVWFQVPKDAVVVGEPNRYGPAIVWPFEDLSGKMQIRCFLPSAGA